MLFHFGVGYQQNKFSDDAPVLDYNPERDLGLKGATVNRLFPAFRGMSNAQGGMKDMGPGSNRQPMIYQKPTANTSLSWVKNNHTYKFGSELKNDGYMSTLYSNTNGIYTFSPAETGLPYLQATTVGGGTVGHPYTSFLLGSANTVRIAPVNTIRLGKHQLGFFAQDTWKVTRKFTLDYGLRWDYSTYLKEQHGRLASAFMTYASGLPILAPAAQNNLNQLLLRNVTTLSYANRVPGQPLFTQDLNCHCFDPNQEFVLNPNARTEPAPGQFGTGSAYYSDYRFTRIPQENFAFGRTFRISEGASFNIRAEFSNIFNRVIMPNPASTNARATQTKNAGKPTAGFGFINTAAAPTVPTSRQGTIVGRLTF